MAALREARFDDASSGAARVLDKDAGNPYARLVAAVARYRSATQQIATDIPTIVVGAMQTRAFNQDYLRMALEQFEKQLGLVEDDLAVAAKEPELTYDLCIACWQVDWNRDGEIDARDHALLEIELDANGDPLPEGDPRRRPTYRYDHGDVQWARAFVAFQRAAVDMVLAYRWSELSKMLPMLLGGDAPKMTFQLEHPERIAQARSLILSGLDLADQARLAYLAETDDEREWVPNPRQKSHPMPMEVDEALYQTWEQLISDGRKLVRGEEGLGVGALLGMTDEAQGETLPKGYLDIGTMLSKPKDIVIDLGQLRIDAEDENPEPLLEHLFGNLYKPQMTPSQLPTRLTRMKGEIERGEDTYERKVRYLLWLN
jgi:hypothetical protein